MKSVLEMIQDLNKESTVADFKAILAEREKQWQEKETVTDGLIKKREDEIKALQEKVVKLVESTVKPTVSFGDKPDIRHSEVFRAAYKKDLTGLYKNGGSMLTGASEEWKDAGWNMGDAAQKAALGTVLRGDATTGSYLVPVEYSNEVFRIAKQASVMLGRVTTVPMAARSMYFPVGLTDSSLTWVTDETTAKTESAPTFDQVNLVCKTCAAWFAVTDELMEDSNVNLAEYFRNMFAEAWGQEADNQILVANTAPFIGMTRNTSVNAVNMSAGKTGFSSVSFQDLLDMESAISVAKGENALSGAVWIMHRKVFNYLRAKKDDNGQPLYQAPAEGVPATIYGRPYLLSDKMPSTDAVSTGFIILGNPKYWLHGDRVGMQFQIFDQTYARMQYDEIFFRFRIRQGFIAAIPGAFAVLKTAAS
jgi:HK97 family phage major capsid protein